MKTVYDFYKTEDLQNLYILGYGKLLNESYQKTLNKIHEELIKRDKLPNVRLNLALPEISRLVQENNHTLAYLEVCYVLGFSEIKDKLIKLTNSICEYQGLDVAQSALRYDLYNQMLEEAKKVLIPEDFDRLYSCL